MDTYVGLDGHVSSCTLGVLGPGGKRQGSARRGDEREGAHRGTLQRPISGPGWRSAVQTQPGDGRESLTAAFLCWFLGCLVVCAALFGTGFVVYVQMLPGLVCLALVVGSGYGLFKTVPRVGFLE